MTKALERRAGFGAGRFCEARALRPALLRATALTAPAVVALALLASAPAMAGGSGADVTGAYPATGRGSDGSATNAHGAFGESDYGGGTRPGGDGAWGSGGGGNAGAASGGGLGGEGFLGGVRAAGGGNTVTIFGPNVNLAITAPIAGLAGESGSGFGLVPITGGGGGGAAFAVDASAMAAIITTSGAGTITGGAGGSAGPNGGGGGGGGDGVAVSGANISLTIGATVTGGSGGGGGLNFTGGGGGAGVALGNGGTLVVNANIVGGAGGIGPFGPVGMGGGGAGIGAPNGGTIVVNAAVRGGAGFNGGAGIIGQNLDVTVSATGSVVGGANHVSNRGRPANAITFWGGVNALELQAGATITGNVVGTGSDTLRLGGASAGSFDVSKIATATGGAEQYQGFSALKKVGSSVWTLTGTNAFAAAVSVAAGKLVVDGSIANAPVAVASGGALAGVGSVGAVTAAAGSTLTPGSGVAGTSMTMASLTMAAGSTYAVAVNPTTASFAQVAGVANLGGAGVVATFAPGAYIAKQYAILKAGSVAGTFSGVTSINLPSGFATALSYDARTAYLDLSLYTAPTQPAGPTLPTGGGLNARNVAQALQTSFNLNGGIPAVYGGLDATGLALASGQTQAGASTSLFRAMTDFVQLFALTPDAGADRISAQSAPAGALGYAPTLASADAARAIAAGVRPAPRPAWEVWGQAYGGVQTIDRDAALAASAVTDRAGGFVVGVNYRPAPDLAFGLGVGVGATSFSLGQGFGSGHGETAQLGVSALKTFGASYLNGALAYGFAAMHTTRATPGGASVSGRFDAQALQARLEAGHRFDLGGLGLTPYGALALSSVTTPGYAETSGAGVNPFALRYAGKTRSDPFSELGLKIDRTMAVEGGLLTLSAQAGWRHDFRRASGYLASFTALPNASFIARGATANVDSAVVSAGARMQWANGYALAAKVEADLARNSRSVGAKLALSYAW